MYVHAHMHKESQYFSYTYLSTVFLKRLCNLSVRNIKHKMRVEWQRHVA